MAAGRRDSAAVGALHELASHTELKKCLECPICTEVPLAPIYTCSRGHTTCGKCREQQKCGVCHEDLSHTQRNAAIELIVANSSFWCKHFDEGCAQIVKGSEYRNHADECEFRAINCFETETRKCNGLKVRFKDYFRHLKEVHEIEGFEMKTNELVMSEYSNDLRTDGPWPAYYMEYGGEVFVRNLKIERSVAYWWFSIIGSQSAADKYRVRVTVYMKHDPRSRCAWTIPVYSIRSSPDTLEEAFRVAIPTRQLEVFSIERDHPHGEKYRFVFDLKYEIFTV